MAAVLGAIAAAISAAVTFRAAKVLTAYARNLVLAGGIMTSPDPLARTTLSVSGKAHKAVQAMQGKLRDKLGYRVTQSETVIRGMEALAGKDGGREVKGRIVCNFCGEQTREHDLNSAAQLQNLSGVYLAHLVESHWPELVDARNQRVLQPMNERTLSAWKRL